METLPLPGKPHNDVRVGKLHPPASHPPLSLSYRVRMTTLEIHYLVIDSISSDLFFVCARHGVSQGCQTPDHGEHTWFLRSHFVPSFWHLKSRVSHAFGSTLKSFFSMASDWHDAFDNIPESPSPTGEWVAAFRVCSPADLSLLGQLDQDVGLALGLRTLALSRLAPGLVTLALTRILPVRIF